MTSGRENHTATLLGNGQVLVAGGESSSFAELSTAVLFTEVGQTWGDAGSMVYGRIRHNAVLLHDGTVLVAGGTD